MKPNKLVLNTVTKVEKILGLENIKVDVDDYWSQGLKVYGFAGKPENTIYLNQKQKTEENMIDTICHEMCHLKAARHGHGDEWQNLMNLCREREVIK